MSFTTVATTDEIGPGDVLVVEMGRTNVLVYNIDGQFYAMEDRCSHADVDLSDGQFDLEACTVKCSAHGAIFDMKSGVAMGPPAVMPVRMFEVRVEGDDVQVGQRIVS